MLAKLKSHGARDRARKSSVITKRLLSLDDFIKAKNIFVYVSKDHEVTTLDIIKTSLKLGKNVYCPIIRNDAIKAGNLEDMQNLRLGAFEVLEPQKITRRSKFDIVIVPGIAFDKNGSRLGHGGGYFDAFLPKVSGRRIALAFDFQLLDKVETKSHDTSVDTIITERRLIDFKKLR